MTDRFASLASSPATGFVGLRVFAIDGLDRARVGLQRVGEPVVFDFHLDGSHLVMGSAAQTALLAKVKVAVPRGAMTIYYLRPVDANEQTIALIRAFFTETKQKGDGGHATTIAAPKPSTRAARARCRTVCVSISASVRGRPTP